MKKYFSRTLYLLYYIKNTKKSIFDKFLKYVSKEMSKSEISILRDVILSSYKYNISLIEYFNFKFYKLTDEQRKTYAGAGFMYEYQLIMNPIKHRKILQDKLFFLKAYSQFINHKHISINDLNSLSSLSDFFKKDKIVLKSTDGQCGEGIEVRSLDDFNKSTLVKRLQETGNDFVEEFIYQHDDLDNMSSSGLNTVRIITQYNQGKVDIIAARLRITINSSVDNLAAGNIAAPIDIVSGKVSDKGVYSDITKQDEEIHPISKEKIIGFKIPYWIESLEIVKKAALLHPENRSIGWDVAITNEGPELLEGNHNWCRLLWQLPVRKGLKHELEKYL